MRVATTDAASLRRVAAQDFDVVCVTGGPRYLRWRSRAAKLAREAGLLYVTGVDARSGVVLLAPLRTHVIDVTVQGNAAVALVEVGGQRAAVATGPVDSPYDAPLIVCDAPGPTRLPPTG
jgi:hypothetical protein